MNSNKLGTADKIKQCKKEWAAAHPEKIRAAEIKYKTEHPDKYKAKQARYNESHRAVICEYSRRYRSEHPEHIQEYMQGYLLDYYLEHKGELIEYQRHWRATPMGKAVQRATKLKRRAVKIGSKIGDDVDTLIKQIRLSPVVICHLCGATLPGNECHIDHIIPLSKGGAHTRENIAPACPVCNIKKGAKLPEAFQQTWVCR